MCSRASGIALHKSSAVRAERKNVGSSSLVAKNIPLALSRMLILIKIAACSMTLLSASDLRRITTDAPA
jgi:hypothetical protein